MSGTAGKTVIALTPVTREALHGVQRDLTMKRGRAVSASDAVAWLIANLGTDASDHVSRETRQS